MNGFSIHKRKFKQINIEKNFMQYILHLKIKPKIFKFLLFAKTNKDHT